MFSKLVSTGLVARFRSLVLPAVSLFILVQPNGALAATGSPAPSGPNTWYVSSLATGTVHDGKSWATAWWDFSGSTPNQRIDWSQVQPGDTINVDAGAAPPPGYVRSVIYHTPLVVQKSNITIQIPNDPNHNGGMASIQTNNSSATSIDLSTYSVSNVTIQGSKWNPAGVPRLVPNFGTLGGGTALSIGPNSNNIILRNLQLQWANTGLDLKGGTAYCYYMMINDNVNNVVSEPGPSSQPNNYYRNPTAYMYYTWVYDIYTARPTTGLLCRSNQSAAFNLSTYYSVFGPGLSRSIQTTSPRDNVNISYTLFIDPTITNLQVGTAPSNCSLYYDISFLTPLNPSNQSHSCFGPLSESPGITVFGNVVYGGVVNVQGTQSLGYYNEQFKTSGNTQVLSASQVDPKFASNVSVVPNQASFTQLIGLNFTPSVNTPGSPYCIHSVEDLLSRVPH